MTNTPIVIHEIATRVDYQVGSTPVEVFGIPFTFFDAGGADIRVFVGGAQLDSSDYSVQGAGGFTAGFPNGQVLLATPVSETVVTVERRVPLARTTAFPEGGGDFSIKALNLQLARLVAMAQQLDMQQQRSLRMPPGDPGSFSDLPPAAERDGKLLGFTVGGQPIAVEPGGGGGAGESEIAVLDDVAALEAFDPLVVPPAVTLLGYHAPGDGAGAVLVHDPDSEATPNGGTVFQAPAIVGRFIDWDGGWLRLKRFGAVGDGTTDDHQAIQSWLNAIVETERPGWIDPGKYDADGATVYWNRDGTATGGLIEGLRIEGPGRSTGQPDSGAAELQSILISIGDRVNYQTTEGRSRRLELAGFAIRGGLEMWRCEQSFKMESIRISPRSVASVANGGQGVGLYLVACNVANLWDVRSDGGDGVDLGGIWIEGCNKFTMLGGGANNNLFGIRFDRLNLPPLSEAGQARSYGVTLLNSYFEDNIQQALYARAVHGGFFRVNTTGNVAVGDWDPSQFPQVELGHIDDTEEDTNTLYIEGTFKARPSTSPPEDSRAIVVNKCSGFTLGPSSFRNFEVACRLFDGVTDYDLHPQTLLDNDALFQVSGAAVPATKYGTQRRRPIGPSMVDQYVKPSGTGIGLSWVDEGGDEWAQIQHDSSERLRLAVRSSAGGAVASSVRLRPEGYVEVDVGGLRIGTEDAVASTNTHSLTGIALDDAGEIFASASAGVVATLNRAENDTADRAVLQFRRGGVNVASISATNTTVTYATSSDRRLKDNLAPADAAAALERLARVSIYDFTWKSGGAPGRGVVADELQEVVPAAVTGTKDGMRPLGRLVRKIEGAPDQVLAEGVEERAARSIPACGCLEDAESGAVLAEDVPKPARLPKGRRWRQTAPAAQIVWEQTGEEPDHQGVDYSKLVPDLVLAVQALKADRATLQLLSARIEALEVGR